MHSVEAADEIINSINSAGLGTLPSSEYQIYTLTTLDGSPQTVAELTLPDNSVAGYTVEVLARQISGSRGFVGDGTFTINYCYAENIAGSASILASYDFTIGTKPTSYGGIGVGLGDHPDPEIIFQASFDVFGPNVVFRVLGGDNRTVKWVVKIKQLLISEE